MKILAIRGGNLASLHGDFEVDLEAEPLASAGLFAITGPTGAGKSTLLDALCLALFDCTPRLVGSSGALVGRKDQEEAHRIRATDVRGLLTRGQATGFAEVDFANRDGRRWRARWEARRARGRADGRLQKQDLRLEDLVSGDPVGHTKTEVLKAIQAEIGLTFDQFRRSALLAQGDFAAFLHAASDTRADLLEKVTGTEIYTRLSKAAHVRAAEERKSLDSLRDRRDALGLLAAETRRELEEEAAAASQELVAASAALEAAKIAVAWHEELARLQKLEKDGEEARRVVVEQWEASGPRRDALERIRAAQPLRPVVDTRDAAITALAAARARVDTAKDARQAADERLREAEQQVADARSAKEATRQLGADREPEIERATALDLRLEEIESQVARAREEAAGAKSQAEDAARCATDEAAKTEIEEKKLAQAEAWLDEHPDAEALHGAWKHLDTAFADFALASAAASRADAALPKLEEAERGAATDAQQAIDHVAEAQGALADLEKAVGLAEAAIPEGRREALDARSRSLEMRRDRLRQAEGASTEARAARDAAAEAEDAARKARETRRILLEEIAKKGVEQEKLEVRRDEAGRALRALEAALGLEERRAELQTDQPCPLCGSTTHPYRHDGPPADTLADQRRRLSELETRATALVADIAQTQERQQGLETEASERDRQAMNARARLDSARDAWRAHRETLLDDDPPLPELPEDPLADQATTALEEIVAASRQALAELENAKEEFQRLERTAKDRRAQRDQARAKLDACLAARDQAKEAKEAADTALVETRRRRDEAAERAATALRALETGLARRPGWKELLDADCEAFRVACLAEVEEFGRQAAARRDARARLDVLRPAKAKAEEQAVAARDSAAKSAQISDGHLARLDAQRKERAAILGGRPVAEIKQEFARRSERDDQALDAALKNERQTRDAATTAEAELKEATKRLKESAEAAQGAEQRLADVLAEQEIDLETLRERLAHDTAWCDAEARSLGEIQERIQKAESVLEERRERRAEHEKTEPPELPADEAAARRTNAAKEHRQAEEKAGNLRVRIRQDNDARARAADLGAEIAEQETRSDRWAKLNEVIGSHDGAKFRKFAQGLTLDSLLGHANAHLRDLAPRYKLERVPGEDLELQVIDGDMGDEVRSIKSLSGGETFLASLALALGLSSLSASETPVKSLFIDEGFGTLDPETLEIALSALDALQASGRQVGIISHVQDLGQRIGVEVRVVKEGAGRSRVETVGGF